MFHIDATIGDRHGGVMCRENPVKNDLYAGILGWRSNHQTIRVRVEYCLIVLVRESGFELVLPEKIYEFFEFSGYVIELGEVLYIQWSP